MSRVFSNQTGQTMTQHLRQLRMERAAELLKSREYNVTEVALEVGYSSLSHFSAAFQETFGCCPGLYPLATTTQKVRAWDPWLREVTSPAIWTRQWGQGRIFVTTPGHSIDVLEHPSVRTIIERGLLWASR